MPADLVAAVAATPPPRIPEVARRITPDSGWPRWGPDVCVRLAGDPADPAPYPPLILRGAPRVTIVTEQPNGAKVVGDLAGPGGEPPSGLRVMDGCDDFTVDGLGFQGSRARGLRITGCQRVAVRFVRSWGHGLEAVILGDCPGASLSHLECFQSAPQAYQGYGADQQHAIYLAGNAAGTQGQVLYCHHVTGSGIQVNGATMGRHITGLALADVRLDHCGSGGTPALSLMAVVQSLFQRWGFTSDQAGVTMFEDGRGGDWGCHDNRFEDFVMDAAGKFTVHEILSGNNTWLRAVGFTPPAGDTVLTTPPPLPIHLPPVAPAGSESTGDLAAALAAALAARDGLRRDYDVLTAKWERARELLPMLNAALT